MNENSEDNSEEERLNIPEDIDYDTLLASAGNVGWYQIILLISIAPFFLFDINVYFSQLFITLVPPEHWCWIPELNNLTDVERRNLAIPKDIHSNFGYSQCKVYEANWTEVLLTGHTPNDTWKQVQCQKGWEFNWTEFPYPTISTDLGWVCEKDDYPATAQSVFFAGSAIGGILVGWVADRYGRIPALVGCNLIACIGGLCSIFVTNLTQFSLCRFIMGMAYDNCLAFVIALEYMAPKYRSVLVMGTLAISYSMFTTSFPFIALASGHWKILSLVTSLPLGLALFTPCIIPESPRWLLSKGRVDETIEKVQKIAQFNRQVIPTNLIKQFKANSSKVHNVEKVSSLEIFKNSQLRKILIFVCLSYMSCRIVFDGLLRNLESLDFNFFLSFAASSSTELPSLMLCAFITDFFGRRWIAVMMLSITCLCCVLIVFVNGVPSVVFAAIARFAMTTACNTVSQWSAEVLPTPLRSFGVSLIHICSNLGTMISPYIAYLKVYTYWLPFLINACIAAFGIAMALLLPETAKKVLPHTIVDAENLARSYKFWETPCLQKQRVINKDMVSSEMANLN